MKNKDKLLNAKDSELKCILKSICYYKLINPSIKKIERIHWKTFQTVAPQNYKVNLI